MRVAILALLAGGLLVLGGSAAGASCRCRPIADYRPVWSPDDSALEYTEAYESAHVVSLADHVDRRVATVVPDVVYSPNWTQWAAVVLGSDYELIVSGADGNIRRLDRAFPTPPSWSPDGEWLAYVGGDQSLYVIRADGGARQLVAADINPYGARSASWSPDGSQLAYVSGKDVYVASVAGGGARNLTSRLEGSHVDPLWSPRGDLIAVVTDFGAALDVVTPDGSVRAAFESMLPVAHGGIALSWSPAGDRFLYSYRFNPTPGSPGVYEVDVGAFSQRRIVLFGIDASFSHDGGTIAFGGNVTIEPNPPNVPDCVGVGIWTVPSSGGSPTLVTRTCTTTPPLLSIHAPNLVDYGAPASVSGGALPGTSDSVLLSARPCSGAPPPSRLVDATDGAWEANVAPRVTTAYTVEANGPQETATIAVRPVVTLRPAGKLRYVVKVLGPRSFVGRVVHVNVGRRRLTRVVLRTATRSGTSYTSVARFRVAPRELRVFQESMVAALPRSTCLAAGLSNTLAVSRP